MRSPIRKACWTRAVESGDRAETRTEDALMKWFEERGLPSSLPGFRWPSAVKTTSCEKTNHVQQVDIGYWRSSNELDEWEFKKGSKIKGSFALAR